MHIELPEQVREQLDPMADTLGANSYSEVIRRALGVYALILKNAREGGQTIVRSTNGDEVSIVIA